MDDSELVSRLTEFFKDRNAVGFNVLDFVHAEGSPLIALMYSRLFWPEFERFNDMTFLKETIEDEADRERVRGALDRNGGDKAAVERSFNLRELEDLFGARINDTTDYEDTALAERLRAMWQCRLGAAYGDRSFSVLVVPPEETGGSIGITFYEIGE